MALIEKNAVEIGVLEGVNRLTSGDKSIDLSAFKLSRLFFSLLSSGYSVVRDRMEFNGYLDDLQFGVGVSGGGEAILYAVNRLIEDRGDDIGLSMLLVDFKNAFNLVDREVMLEEVHLRCPVISRWVEFCYSSQLDCTIGNTLYGHAKGCSRVTLLALYFFSLVLHPLICKIGDSFSLFLQAWYLDDVTIIGDTLAVRKVLELIMEDGPRCGLYLNVDKAKVFWPTEDSRSRFASVFLPNIAQPLHGAKLLGGPASVDFNFSSELVMKRVAKTIVLIDTISKINDPQCELLLLRACACISKLYFAMRTCSPHKWRLATLPFAFGWLCVYCASDVFNYAFLVSRLQHASLQTKLLLHYGIVASGPAFHDALCAFNTKMKTGLLKSNFSVSSRQIALWQSQMEDHTSDWLRVVSISWLGQTMNACSKVFTRDIYEDHVVFCAGIIGIKHQHNVVRDTLVDICFRSEISAGNKVDIGLGGGSDKPLRPADMLLYSWDEWLDMCVDLTGSSPLTQTGMVDFVPGPAVIDATHRKWVKYEAKCANIGYGFLPFSFSSLGELDKDAVTILKRIRKFSVTQDIGARAAIHIFNRINFTISKGVGAQLVSRLPTNFL
uniref:Reverse transcriptase domain-containing protein n=1 Tax=Tanacetum cinerariifolium TaxID=118510 RepID=A0A699GZ74_TANCI|nr:hypothetical protein [Tanacetum cinerariifolium]